MRRSVFAICDAESAYVEQLMEYLHAREQMAFEIQAFTSTERLCACAAEKPIAVLLISARVMCESVERLHVGQIVLLSEGEEQEAWSEYPSVYKYQDVNSLIGKVRGVFAEACGAKEEQGWRRQMQLLGVCAIGDGVEKTAFALAFGQALAREERVLYLNLEDFAGFEAMMGKQFGADLSDLIYLIRQGGEGTACRLERMVQSVNRLDYVPPAFLPGDLGSVTLEEWKRLLEEIAAFGCYQAVILELNPQIHCLIGLLEMCDRIYMPVREDGLSRARLEQYEQILRMQGREKILRITRKFQLPFYSLKGLPEHGPEQLLWGEFGNCVENLAREWKEEIHGRGRGFSAGAQETSFGEAGSDKGSHR